MYVYWPPLHLPCAEVKEGAVLEINRAAIEFLKHMEFHYCGMYVCSMSIQAYADACLGWKGWLKWKTQNAVCRSGRGPSRTSEQTFLGTIPLSYAK